MKESTSTWEYDGTFSGFLMVVYLAFHQQVFPATIVSSEQSVENLFLKEAIVTDNVLAKKIAMRLKKRLGKNNWRFINDGFCCTLLSKERYLLDAIEIGFSSSDNLENHLGHPSILALTKAIQTLYREAHAFKGFIRLEYIQSVLYGAIQPKHYSLPYICPHFARRYPNELLMIYDETHRLLAIIEKGKTSFIEDTDTLKHTTDASEIEVQFNWRTFLQSTTIHERENKRSQLSHLPKRFRNHMVDFD